MEQRWGQPFVAWSSRLRPTRWDLVAVPLVLGAIMLFSWGGQEMSVPYKFGDELPISLDPSVLPEYALRTVLRMFLALIASFIFSLAYSALAAKSRHAEKLLIPALDVLQSVPILGFLSITVTGFIAMFPGSLLGVECAAIFAIFTSQAWNMAFSVFQSFRTLPGDLIEASRMYHLSAWGRFWRLEVPHAMPNLIWNMMMSVSGGWFFVVASEAITVSSQTIKLPGIGSYIATAIEQRDLTAIYWAVLVMFIVIILYDQLLFRPLLAWSRKFKVEELSEEEPARPWFLVMVQRARIFDLFEVVVGRAMSIVSWTAKRRPHWRLLPKPTVREVPAWVDIAWDIVLILGSVASLVWLVFYIQAAVPWSEIGEVCFLGFVTAVRVLVLILLASLIWVPIGVWIGLRPGISDRAQAIVQFMAAFPANLFFPIAVTFILRYHLNVEIWVSPL
ncbi:MAG: ABC transporter permease subunit, partial [Alphaproteobacteria bacterium]|nr:ABC transporter permease subunit [Alphaproteobacteria bacterium]